MHRFIYLGGYDFIKSEYAARRKIQDSSGKRNKMLLAERYAAAQIVSMSASTLHYPLDCVRRRLMMQAGVPKEARKYRNAFQCFVRVWNEEGVRGFYLGLGPNLLRCVGSALALVFYDEFKRILISL
jgi:solute carrier family 25 (adenine nucleotide translocator) protein 4/5/6/31